jgi:hypothetical protein
LEDFVALLLAAAEAFVDAAMQQIVLQVQHRELFAHEFQELHRIQFRLPARLALRVERGAQEVGVVHARDLDRVLEGEEHAFGRALLRFRA